MQSSSVWVWECLGVGTRQLARSRDEAPDATGRQNKPCMLRDASEWIRWVPCLFCSEIVCNWTARAVLGWVHGRHQRACTSRRHELGKAAPLSPQPWLCDCGSYSGELKFGLYVTNLNSFKLTIKMKPITRILISIDSLFFGMKGLFCGCG